MNDYVVAKYLRLSSEDTDLDEGVKEESNSIVNQIADICAYADEVILKWVVGENELNDASWAEYCDRLESLGLGEVTAVYQKAYDDFIAEFGA